jgi:hypothetical protein
MVVKIKGGLPKTEDNGYKWGDFFREVTLECERIWWWHGYKYIIPDEDVICLYYTRSELTYANACEPLPNDDILTTFQLD